MERFLYRLSRSEYAKKFILKGALLLTAWRAPWSRPTVDIDLMEQTSNELDHIRVIIDQLCNMESEADGIQFDSSSISAARIKEDADYEGVRVRFQALLPGAKIPMQIDRFWGCHRPCSHKHRIPNPAGFSTATLGRISKRSCDR